MPQIPKPSKKLVDAVQALFGSAFTISQPYHDNPNDGVKDHDGVDIAAKKGTELRTIDAGKVSYAEDARIDDEKHRLHHWAKGGGNVVNIDISKKKTIQYAHLDTISVKVGDKVVRGQKIGTVGQTGGATGPHVHFGLWHHGNGMVEPTSYLANLAGQAPAGPLAAEVATPMATITVLERYEPVRRFTVPAGTTIRGYDPAQPGMIIRDEDFPNESSASAVAKVAISWPNLDPQPTPHGTFYLVADGAFEGQYIKVQLVTLDAGAPAPVEPGNVGAAAPDVPEPEATITVVEQYESERHFTIPPGTTVRAFDPARPGKVIRESTFVDGSGAHASAMVVIAWPHLDPQPIPHGTFLAVTDGLFAGCYIKAQLVSLDPIVEAEAELTPEPAIA